MADRSVVYRIIADIGNLQARMAQGSASVKKLGDDVTKVGKEGEKTRKGLDTMGRTAGRVGLIAAAGLGLMVAKAANFEQAMSLVAAATHESEKNMGLLRDAAIDAGAATQFTAEDAAGAITNLAKAGVATTDILSGGLAGALSLAAAGELEVADAAEDIATAMTQFQLEGKKATHVADLLAAGAGKAQGEVGDMANALKFAGVPAANLGVSIEETAGSIALLAKNGIIGEQAGTSLRGILSSLTSPSKIAKKTLDDLGITMFNQKGKFIGLAGVADQLSSHMKTLTDEERANALGKIFGNEQLTAANVLYREGGQGVRDWTRNVDDAGFAADTAAIKTDNLKGDLERLGGSIDTLLIKGGAGSQGFLRGVTQGAEDAVNAAGALPDSFANVLSGMLAITAVTGGGLWFGTKVIRGISETREALKNLGDGAGKASGALKGLASAGAALAVLTVVAEGVKAIQRATAETLPGLDTLTKRLLDLRAGDVASIGAEFDSLGDSIERVGDTSRLDQIADGINKVVFFGGEASNLSEGKAEIAALDQALANLVSNGRPDAAAEALSAVAQSSELTADQVGILRTLLPGYQDALDGMATSSQLAADAHEGMGKKVKIAGQAVHFTADQIKDAQDAYDDAREQAAGVADGFIDISAKADKAKLSLHDWLSTLVKQSEALENFVANAKTASSKGVSDGLIGLLEQQGAAGALRLQQLAKATPKEIARANDIFKRIQKAKEAAVDLLAGPVPDELRTDVKIIDDDARRKLRALKQKFMESEKPVITQMKVDNHQALAGLTILEGRLARLRQLAIITPRMEHTESRLGRVTVATGGHIRGPGSATSDSIPAYLSNGEYVIKAAAVARYGVAMFDRMNAMHFAQGGPVGGGGGFDMGALAGLLAQGGQQPLANVINLMPHDYNEFTRQDARLRSAGSTDGWRKR